MIQLAAARAAHRFSLGGQLRFTAPISTWSQKLAAIAGAVSALSPVRAPA
jgi:hypothetical protein